MMHPNLVAGAWVGFNDNRVTIRSSYWGQGGHNAALVVGDFFRGAFDNGSLDAKATLPGWRPPEPRRYVVEEEPEEIFMDEAQDIVPEGGPEEMPVAPPLEAIEPPIEPLEAAPPSAPPTAVPTPSEL